MTGLCPEYEFSVVIGPLPFSFVWVFLPKQLPEQALNGICTPFSARVAMRTISLCIVF